MTYRNIFFLENSVLRGSGNIIVEYTGKIYTNARAIKNFHNLYDASKDLMISCTSCAKQKYSQFIKVTK